MYLEYKVINGVLSYKTSPSGKWHECSREEITEKYVETMETLKKALDVLGRLG